MTATTDDVAAAFEAALAADAGASVPPEVPAPPRIDHDPKAPHGRAEDGSPLAPHGLKADGTPRLKPAGPGRPKGDDKPRVAAAAASPAGKGGGADYTADLMDLGHQVWMGASMIRGGKLGPIRLPDARPFAFVWQQQLASGAAAWNEAAKQNATVRGWVQKFSGDGSASWVIGVGIWGIGLVSACVELAKAPAEVRAQAAAANDAAMQEFIGKQVEAMGLTA